VIVDPRTISVVNLPHIAANALPSDLMICASGDDFKIEAAAAGTDPKAPRKFSMTAYTGVAMRLPGWPYPVVASIDATDRGEGLRTPRQSVPIDRDHNALSLVGHTTAIDKTMQRVYATGVISGHHESEQTPSAMAAREVLHLAAGGFPWQASIFAEPTPGKVQFVDKGESVKINGRNVSGPAYAVWESTLQRISFTANGADGNTSASVAASSGGQTVNDQWIIAQGFDPKTLNDKQRTFLQAAWDAEQARVKPPAVTPPAVTPPVQAAATPPADPIADIRASASTEINRIGAVRRICAAVPGLSMEVDDAANPGKKKTVLIEAHAIAEGWGEEKTELAVVRAARPVGNHSPAGSSNAGDMNAEAIEASLCLQAGIPEARVAKWFTPQVMNQAVSAPLRAASIVTVMHETIRAAGLHAHPGKPTDETIRMAIRADRSIAARHPQPIAAAGGFSAISLSGILSNVANKAMINSYEAVTVVWPQFCAVRSHGDFKVHTRYRLDSTGAFLKVGADGELKHIGLTDASYTNQLDTFGAIISLTRQMQINDDLGAFMEIPTILGRMAAVRVEEGAFVLLLSNPSSFFHANNKNLVAGAGGAMTAANGLAAITSAEQKFSDQVDSNGKPVLLTPAVMLTGTANYIAARNIYEGRVKITGDNATQVADNEHAGKYEPVKSPYVNNTAIKDQGGAAITGQSSTKWWLFADPSVRAAIAVAFLNGQRLPTINSADTEFSTLGMQWRGYLDVGFGMEDPVAAVQVNGA